MNQYLANLIFYIYICIYETRASNKSTMQRTNLMYILATFLGLVIIVVMLSIHTSHHTTDQSQRARHKRSGELQDSALEKHLPQAIIIGARKSGTRALLRFLEVNPDVRAAHSEVHFFDRDTNYERGLEWYRQQMPSARRDQLTIEKSPAYLVTAGVPERVRLMNSSIKLIVIMRDPVFRLISDYSQIVSNQIDDSTNSLNEDEDMDEDNDYHMQLKSGAPKQGGRHDSQNDLSESMWSRAAKSFASYVLRHDGGINEQRRAVSVGMYSMHLERWLALFPANQIHYVDGEQLIYQPYEVLRELESFLNLAHRIKRENFIYNPQKRFYCVASTNDRDESNMTDLTSRLSCLSKAKGRRHVHVEQNLIDKLREFYAPYNEYLYSLTGKEFDWPMARAFAVSKLSPAA